jgi:hypothetical protein
MVNVTYEPNWINDDFFYNNNPARCNILHADVKKDKNDKEEIVITIGSGKLEAKMSVWGKNKQKLAVAYGDGRNFDTDDLLGKQIRLMQEVTPAGKKIRTLETL